VLTHGTSLTPPIAPRTAPATKGTPARVTNEGPADDRLARVQAWCEAYDAAGKPHRGGRAALAGLVGCGGGVITWWKNNGAPCRRPTALGW